MNPADKLAALREAMVGRFVIHTANPDGRMAMRQALEGWYKIREVDVRRYL